MSDLDFWRNADYIKCPHCMINIDDLFDYEFPIQHEYNTEIDCPECEEKIFVTQYIEFRYSSAKESHP